MRYLLLACCVLSAYPALAQRAKPRALYQRNAAIFTKLAAGFAPEVIVRAYRAYLTLSAVEPNPVDATLQDSIWLVVTPADHLTLRKTSDYLALEQASVTSARLSLGGMRVGTFQTNFCRRLHLSLAYDAYSFLRAGELFEQISCFFARGQLTRIEYKHPTNLSQFR